MTRGPPVARGTARPRSVGTLREGPLHAALKDILTVEGGRQEVEVDGYVVDVVREDGLVEVQTGGFGAIRAKLTHLLERHRVRLVHPVAAVVQLVSVDADGVEGRRRRSPRRGVPADAFAALVGIPHLLVHPRLTLEVWLTEEAHLRPVGGRRRRRGTGARDRHLIDVLERRVVARPADLLELVPGPDPFTTAELARALGRPRRLAQQVAYCLHRAGVTARVGKQGNAVVYAREDGSGRSQSGSPATASATGARR